MQRILLGAIGFAVLVLPLAEAGATATTGLYSFTGPTGGSPGGTLIMDAAGNLYGTTESGGSMQAGVVFKLAPVAGKTTWTESVLYSFKGGADGGAPHAGLLLGAGGVLYGTTQYGGAKGAGTVFSLTAPSGGTLPWTETVLHSFTGVKPDGSSPTAALIADTAGALYGTTFKGGAANYGVVFKLSPPAKSTSPWVEQILHSFAGGKDGSNPHAGLIADATGALYGTTVSNGSGATGPGVVFELVPPKVATGAWAEKILLSFAAAADDGTNATGANPYSGLLAGTGGGFYGTTFRGGATGNGTVYQLIPPAGKVKTWTESVIYDFTGGAGGAFANSGLTVASGGTLYGVTLWGGTDNAGTLFKLTPPKTTTKPWTPAVLHVFLTGGTDGNDPSAALMTAPNGVMYGTTVEGGGHSLGEVFKLTP